MSNPYFPHPAILDDIIEEGPGLKTFRARFRDDAVAESFRPMPGQFLECSVYGVGEAPFGVACYNANGGPIRFSAQKIDFPATSTFAPASASIRALSTPTPPSTAMSTSSPNI